MADFDDSWMPSRRGVPDLTGGASSRGLLLEIRGLVGRVEGSQGELSRAVANLSEAFRNHVEEEGGLVAKVELLQAGSQERHRRLYDRLDKLEHAATASTAVKAFLRGVWVGLAAVTGWGLHAALTANPATIHWLKGLAGW